MAEDFLLLFLCVINLLFFKVANQLLDPLCVGIFGGDARRLSVSSCFPFLAELEKQSRSLVLAALVSWRRSDAPTLAQVEAAELISRVRRARLWSMRGGLDRLVDLTVAALARHANVELRTGRSCVRLQAPASATSPLHVQDPKIKREKRNREKDKNKG